MKRSRHRQRGHGCGDFSGLIALFGIVLVCVLAIWGVGALVWLVDWVMECVRGQ
ncbi:MAG: hypothetical protein KIH64_014780 [Mycobacterium sp.]|nr:hypothetical protein [Mycobacterium sp.]